MDPNDEELNHEMEEGARHASDLVHHLISMGASKVMIPVIAYDEKYEVTVRKIPVEFEPE